MILIVILKIVKWIVIWEEYVVRWLMGWKGFDIVCWCGV